MVGDLGTGPRPVNGLVAGLGGGVVAVEVGELTGEDGGVLVGAEPWLPLQALASNVAAAREAATA
jgi:hypothetical protein